VIASGVLGTEADRVLAPYAQIGLRERSRRHDGEWLALLLER
jgi:ribosomal protein L11 methylase PrmA